MATMNEIMNSKGIEINEENSWNWMNHPAKDGEHRWGRIRKELRIYSPSDWGTCNATYATVGLEVNTWDKTVEVHFLKGSMPYANNLFWAMLADRDVRRLIVEYQNSTRRDQYKIWSTTGMSGREDIFMTFGQKMGGFATTRTMKLCHISGFGRLNEGFGNKESKMYIGDFVELCAYMGLTEDMNVQNLRKKAGVKYIRPKFAEEIEDFGTTVTKIL